MIRRKWSSLPIGYKFGTASGLFILIILIETLIGIIGLNIIHTSEDAILVSTDAQRRVLGMGRNWESARRLREGFFLQYPVIGVDKAYIEYALPGGGKLAEIIRDGAALQRLAVSVPDNFLRGHLDNLSSYLSMISLYAATFEESIQLVETLSSVPDGLQARLDRHAEALLKSLQEHSDSGDLLAVYYKMRFYEKEYFIRQKSSLMDEEIEADDILGRNIGKEALSHLIEYRKVFAQIVQTHSSINEHLMILNDFDRSVEPELTGLLADIQMEVINNRDLIDEYHKTTDILLFVFIIFSLSAAAAVRTVLHHSVTRNILRLTAAAAELRSGNLEASAAVTSSDELGQLAQTFNSMTEQLKQTIGRMVLLRKTGLEMARKLDTDHVVTTVLEAALKISNADGAFSGLSCGGEVFISHTLGRASRYRIGSPLPLEKGLLSRVVRQWQTGQEMISDCAEEEGGRDICRARVVLPLVSGDRLIGILAVESKASAAFSRDTVEFLQLLAVHTAVALDNAALYSDVRQLAKEDALTGLYNRRGMFELALHELNRSRRFKRPVSVLFMDVDHFKQFNDRYGYEIGDLILQKVSSCMKENLRDIDVVGRYGGEEFVAVLPELNLSESVAVAERLRKEIETVRLAYPHDTVSVTVSIGVDSMVFASDSSEPSPDNDEKLLTELIEKAGHVLHTAKELGRNRVAAP